MRRMPMFNHFTISWHIIPFAVMLHRSALGLPSFVRTISSSSPYLMRTHTSLEASGRLSNIRANNGGRLQFITTSSGTSSLGFKRDHHPSQNKHFQALQSTVSDDAVRSITTDNNDDDEIGRVENVVMVQRNKQSMAFRQGSQLVFSGAVEATYQIDVDDTLDYDDDIPRLENGALTAVVVNSEKSQKSSGRQSKSRRSNSRGPDKGSSPNNQKTAKHYIVNKPNGFVQAFDSASNDAVMIEDGSQIHNDISKGNCIGFGVFNPSSMYRVRILCHQASHPDLFQQVKQIVKNNDGNSGSHQAVAAIVKNKMSDAIRARLALNLPSSDTDTYRLFNGEGDGLSGLAIDIIGGQVAAVMSSAAWCEVYRTTITEAVNDALSEHPIYSSGDQLKLVWRRTMNRLRQDGIENINDDEEGGNNEDNQSCIVATENGIQYNTYPLSNEVQKTGFYCDQRVNKESLAKLCSGKRVLDLCCYSGGFSLNSLVHGKAASCVGVDSSQDAIDVATANAKLNGLDSDEIKFIRDDISNFMKTAISNGDKFDVIILDPPKLAPSTNDVDRASRKYHALNRDAIKLINEEEGGILLSCTCSAAITQKQGGQFFLETVKGASLAAQRQIVHLQSSNAAPCHVSCPVSFPAGKYLTAALFFVSPTLH